MNLIESPKKKKSRDGDDDVEEETKLDLRERLIGRQVCSGERKKRKSRGAKYEEVSTEQNGRNSKKKKEKNGEQEEERK